MYKVMFEIGNLIIITVIYVNIHLHTPMYTFLSNLAFVDICYPTATLPKLMDVLLSGDNSISFIQCFTQMYFFLGMAAVEVILLASMAYDRYIAICNPLQYHLIMNKKTCALILGGIWVSGCMNSLFFTILASTLSFCHTNDINQLFCDVKALAKISCDTSVFYKVIYIESSLFAVFPFFLCLISYIKIITSILQIKSTNGRKKAFSTCTSHMIVLIMFYGTVLWMYMRPPSEHSDDLDQVFSVLYIAVTPMLNPLVYALRNKEMIVAHGKQWDDNTYFTSDITGHPAIKEYETTVKSLELALELKKDIEQIQAMLPRVTVI
ncbi:olfactory receptor 13F1-like [Rhinophrynus dorsalis]